MLNKKRFLLANLIIAFFLLAVLGALPEVHHAQSPTATASRTGTPCPTQVTGCIGGTNTIATQNANFTRAAQTSQAQTQTAAAGQLSPVPPVTTTVPMIVAKVQYKAADINANDNQIKPHFNIVNTHPSTITLSELKMRYYFTKDGATALQFACDWASRGCGSITGTFVALNPPVSNADTYLEIGFTAGAGSIASGQSTGDIQVRINKSDWTNLNESNDYSFDPTKINYADWTRVTLYRLGSLVWGTLPGGVVPSNTPSTTPSITPTIPTNTPTGPAIITNTPISGSLPDLVVIGIGYNNSIHCKPVDGKSVRVTNQGTAAAGAFVVRLTGPGLTPVEQTVSGLGAGQGITLVYQGYGGQGGSWTASADVTGTVTESIENNNTLATTLYVLTAPPPCTPGPSPTPTSTSPAGPLPDLVIRSIMDGSLFLVCSDTNRATRVIVANSGNAVAGPFIIRVSGATIQEQQIVGLGAGQSLELTFAVQPASPTTPVTGLVDATNLVTEINETNNTGSYTPLQGTQKPPCTPTPGTPDPSLPDLTVTNITNAPPTSMCATDAGTNVTVANNGANAGSFVVSLNGVQRTVSGLAAGQSIVVRFTQNGGNFTATVDSTNLIAESNEANNSLTKTLPVADPIFCTWTPTATRTASHTPTYTSTPTPVVCTGLCSEVIIANMAFTPSSVAVRNYGDQVRWINQDSVSHTVTADNGLFNVTLAPGESFVFTFTIGFGAPSLTYRCSFHPSMTGIIQHIDMPTPTPTNRTPTRTFTPSATPTRTNTPTNGLSVQIRGGGSDNNQQTQFAYVIKNNGSSAVSGVSVRVYFTLDGSNAASNYVLEKYYDQSGVATFSAPTLVSGSTYYVTVSYGTASLAAGAQWELQTSLHVGNWGTTYSAANDWFHTGFAVGTLPAAYTSTNYLPAYVNGTLAWGLQP